MSLSSLCALKFGWWNVQDCATHINTTSHTSHETHLLPKKHIVRGFDLVKVVLVELSDERSKIRVFEMLWENGDSELAHILVVDGAYKHAIYDMQISTCSPSPRMYLHEDSRTQYVGLTDLQAFCTRRLISGVEINLDVNTNLYNRLTKSLTRGMQASKSSAVDMDMSYGVVLGRRGEWRELKTYPRNCSRHNKYSRIMIDGFLML